MAEYSVEDYKELEKKNAALEDELKTTKSAMDDLKDKTNGETDKTKDMQAKLQANEEKMKTQEEKMQAMEKDRETRDEKEKHEIATKVANYELKSEKINDSDVDNRIKELEKNDTNVLQAMLPYAEGEAKEHKEANLAKQALTGSRKPRYEMSDSELDGINKQASETRDFMKGFRSGFY